MRCQIFKCHVKCFSPVRRWFAAHRDDVPEGSAEPALPGQVLPHGRCLWGRPSKQKKQKSVEKNTVFMLKYYVIS